jgi:23S rRNA (guanine745-N1)-methyltransferase
VQPPALSAVLPWLRCPLCAGALSASGATLHCAQGHSFDLARQGYVTLGTGSRGPGTADTASMVAARARFLGGGHYRRIADGISALAAQFVPRSAAGIVVDLAGGTGYYLARTLELLPDHYGLCVDLSGPSLRRAARAHPRIAALGSDIWAPLPLTDDSVALALSVFGPRNIPEIERMLTPGGHLLVATPLADHLGELIEPLGMLSVDRNKAERLATGLARFSLVGEQQLRYQLEIDHSDLAALVAMGPSAHHAPASAVAERLHLLPDPAPVTVSVRLAVYRIAHGTG